MLKNLLIYRFIIFNLMMATLGAVAFDRGLVQHVFNGDSTGIVILISCLFIVAWVATAMRIVSTSRSLNNLKELMSVKASKLPRIGLNRKQKYLAKIKWLSDMSGWLVGLGLIGTVVGFSIALSGIDQNTLADAAGVQTSIGLLMEGMRVALNTTIAGAILGMWNEVNQRMLLTAGECWWSDVESLSLRQADEK